MRVAIGSDHAGFDLKETLRAELAALGHDVSDHGTFDSSTSVDYPDFGAAVGRAVAEGRADLGVCARVTGTTVAVDAPAAFLGASEEHGRHDRRIAKLAALDGERARLHSLEGTP